MVVYIVQVVVGEDGGGGGYSDASNHRFHGKFSETCLVLF